MGETPSFGRTRPFTAQEYMESLRDGREIWIYGERVKDVTTHPAFRNTVRMLARLYDALHDQRKSIAVHRDRYRQRRLHAQVLQAPRATPKKWWARAMRSPNGRASPTAGWAAARITRPRFWPRSARTPSFYTPYRGERPALVQEGAGGSHLRQSRHRQSSGGPQQGTVRSARRLHARREGDRRRPDRQRRKGGRHHLHADALQLHRQQRRAAHQDQGFRVRLHRAHRRARREALLPAVLRDDRGGHGQPVRLPALQPAGRKRLDHRLRQGLRALGERVRLRRYRQGQQLLPALRLPAALHVSRLRAAGREARFHRRAVAQGRGRHRRQGFPRRAGAGGRSAGVAQSVLGAHRRHGAHHHALDAGLRAAQSRLRPGVSRDVQHWLIRGSRRSSRTCWPAR